jgi:hypothetical protein
MATATESQAGREATARVQIYSELASIVQRLHTSTASRRLAGLTTGGLVKREFDASGSRMPIVHVSSASRAVLARVGEIFEASLCTRPAPRIGTRAVGPQAIAAWPAWEPAARVAWNPAPRVAWDPALTAARREPRPGRGSRIENKIQRKVLTALQHPASSG